YDEILQLRNYSVHSENKLFIPIYGPKVDQKMLPESFLSLTGLRIESFSESSIVKLVIRINESINLYLGKKIATEEKSQEIKEKIEGSAPIYISETLKELTKREAYQKYAAQFWYMLGFLALISGVCVAVLVTNHGLIYFGEKENWSLTIFYSLKSIFIIVLLIAASKYCFNLAKSYMNESLKIADRIHAISFGKFYLQVFNQQINPGDIKEIFRDWNINNQTNTFANQSAAEYDPKFLEKLVEIIDKIKGSGADKK
ncbi:MAG TPA: hypothetical protein VFL70_00215, partial [Bacteroidia bacterium]|nr:hypothetical protein [Bacteroidia bacterium]